MKVVEKLLNDINIDVLTVDHAYLDSEWCANDIINPFSMLYIINSGTAYMKNNGKTVKLEQGNAYLIPAKTLYDYWCDTQMEKIYFHFNFSSDFTMFSNINSIIKIPCINADEYARFAESSALSDYFRLKMLMYDTLGSFISEIETGPVGKLYSSVTLGAMKFIQNNLSLVLTAKEIADSLFIAESTLHKTFKAEVGKSIGKYINDMVISESEKMLIRTDVPIYVISDKFGFCDQFYFARRFHQRYGRSPTEHRRAMRSFEMSKLQSSFRSSIRACDKIL